MKHNLVFWALAVGCSQWLQAAQISSPGTRVEKHLNDGWRFQLGDVGTNQLLAAAAQWDDGKWTEVFLPHTPRLEPPEKAQNYFQGVCWYRRHIRPEAAWRGKKVSLQFEGAMQIAEVWVNGRPALTHHGGYLPFSVDITDALAQPGGAVVAVRLDNTDQPAIPPGKPHSQLDFCYFGGLYRDVNLIVSEPLHMTDAVAANRVAGGGIFVRTESADENSATLALQADVQNDSASETTAEIRFTVLNQDGKVVATAAAAPEKISAGTNFTFVAKATVTQPKLWHPDHPWLYTLRTEVRQSGKIADSVSTRFGIRTLACDDKLGFVINGAPLMIRGANRHQDFPWIGNAVPDNAAFRDLKRLKDAGFNFLRLAHYPQSPAVMAACDELGLMVSVCTPGWQYFKADETFTNLAHQNIRDMVRWHRNHPSAVMWEVSLNETYGHDQFYAECARIAHEEYPGGQMFSSGDSYASRDVRHYEVPYTGWGGFYNRGAAPGFEGGKRSFAREYGDYEFGGEHSTTRVPRGAGEDALLLQAWNFVWSHNRNLAMPWLCGDCIWVGVDHFRGCSQENPISRCGVLDYLRLPKFSYHFFQSQRDVNAPKIFIANYWTARTSPTKVVVFSNCEEVELQINGKTVARQKPDAGPDSDYGVWHPEADLVYMAKGKNVHDDEAATAKNRKTSKTENFRAMFDGGNCRSVRHPPFTFAPVSFASGELKAVGYVAGKKVCEDVRQTPGLPAQIKLAADLAGRPLAADGADAVFVRALICDAAGNPVPDAVVPVKFTVSGPARLVSPATVSAEAGVATSLIYSDGTKPRKITLRATAPGLLPAQIKLVMSAAQEKSK
jgi:beta-galactosidase